MANTIKSIEERIEDCELTEEERSSIELMNRGNVEKIGGLKR